MEKTLERLCKKHGLRSISTMLIPASGHGPLTVYVHWGVLGDGNCAGGHGATFNEALALALRNMAVARRPAEEAA